MDRLLDEISIQGSGPVVRTIEHANRSGVISEDAPRWSVEPFVPVHIDPLIECLLGRDELDPQRRQRFQRFCADVHSIHRDRTSSYHRRFSAAYADFDPDSDCRDPLPGRSVDRVAETTATEDAAAGDQCEPVELSRLAKPPAVVDQAEVDGVIKLCDEILAIAGYQKLTREEIEQCAGTASQFGVPLHVDFELFERVEVYSRGDIIGTRFQRRLRNFYRRQQVSVPIYQRMVVIFQLASDEESGEYLSSNDLHLRMFKNIPKQDVDMLMPGTRVRIRGFDRAKFILPSLGGFLLSMRRIAQYAVFFTFLALTKSLLLVVNSVIVVVLIVGYLAKSVFSYFQTKKHYQLNLTRNLYFQKLDSNAGVFYRVIRQAERQSIVEVIIAYYGILVEDGPVSERKLRRRCERLVREAIEVEVDFQIDQALETLARLQLAESTADGWRLK